MKDLKSIIKSLSKKEVKFITDYYKNNEEKKRLLLFKGILSGKFTTDEAAAKKTYGKKGSAYSHLKTRLKDDLLNLLLFTSKDIEHQSAVLQAELKVDRLLLQAKLLHRRKVTDAAIKLLKEAFELCIKYELIKEKVIVTYWYSIIAGNKLGIKVFETINKDFENDIFTFQNYLKAINDRLKLSLLTRFSKKDDQEYIDINKKVFDSLHIVMKKTNSLNIAELYYISAINYYSFINDFNKVYEYALLLNKLIIKNIQVNSITREVNSFLQLFNACLQLKNYKEATNNAIKAYEIITNSRMKESVNELTVLEYIFLSSINQKNLSNILIHLNNGLNHKQVKSSIKIQEKWLFFKSAYFFKINNFSESLASLYKIQILLQDKSGWLFTFKLLEIMCYIEEEEFDMVNFRIESFRKLLSKKNNKNMERIKTIHHVLKSLLKYGFNFEQASKKEKNNIELLKNGENDFYWDPLGFELIRFDEWFLSKVP